MTDRTVETMAREAAQMARARFDDPVRRFPPHYINGFCDGVRDGFKEGHASRDEEVKALREERDRAIAHDTQPYPTAWAYEQACKALVSSDAEIAALRARVAEAEGRAAKWVTPEEFHDYAGRWWLVPATSVIGGDLLLVVPIFRPPVPLPGEEG